MSLTRVGEDFGHLRAVGFDGPRGACVTDAWLELAQEVGLLGFEFLLGDEPLVAQFPG